MSVQQNQNIDIQELWLRSEAQAKTIDRLGQEVDALNSQVNAIATSPVPAKNELINTDYDYSITRATTAAGTDNNCYQWFTHRFRRLVDGALSKTGADGDTLTSASSPFTATFMAGTVDLTIYTPTGTFTSVVTRTSDTVATLTTPTGVNGSDLEFWVGTRLNFVGTTQSLASTGTNGAAWIKTDGWAAIGSSDGDNVSSIDQPLKNNFVTAGLNLYGVFLVKFLSDKNDVTRMRVGIWDSTSGRCRWLEGDDIALTATKIGAHTGGATTHTYKVVGVFDRDGNSQFQSASVNATNCVSPPTAANPVFLEWTNVVGALSYKVYRTTGGTSYLIADIQNGSFSMYDNGTTLQTVSSVPTIGANRARAVALVDVENGSASTWSTVGFTIAVPPTYNQQNTTSSQVFRIETYDGVVSDALLIRMDRMMLGITPGSAWSRSPYDSISPFVGTIPDGSPVDSSQGTGGTGGIIVFPPGTGGNCPAINQYIKIVTDKGVKSIRVEALKRSHLVLNPLTGEGVKIVDLSVVSSPVVRITMANSASLVASPSHPVITTYTDENGTAIKDNPETAVTYNNDDLCMSAVMSVTKAGVEDVCHIVLESPHIFCAGATEDKMIVSHNKPPIDIGTQA